MKRVSLSTCRYITPERPRRHGLNSGRPRCKGSSLEILESDKLMKGIFGAQPSVLLDCEVFDGTEMTSEHSVYIIAMMFWIRAENGRTNFFKPSRCRF